MPEKAKILLTGSSGFVGSNLFNALNSDFEFYGLDIIKRGQLIRDHLVFNWTEINHIPEVEAIIHLAGKAHNTANTTRREEYFDVNLGLTKKIFDYFLDSEATKFIFFSSVAAVANEVVGVLTENNVPAPKTPYGESKLAAEHYILSQKIPKDKDVYILRPCMIHGPGNKGNLNLLYKLVKKGMPWPLGAFDNLRSFASIDNVTFVIRQILEKEIPSGIYQIADDEPVSTNELIKIIAQTLHLNTRIWHIPPDLIRLGASIGDYLRLPLNSERLKKLTESYIVSNMKIKKALAIDSLPTDAKDGLIKTFKSF
jgi:nucleoside-diphosphate-sugar epimerase